METSTSVESILQWSSAVLEASNQACNTFSQCMSDWGHSYSELVERRRLLDNSQNKVENKLRIEEKEQEAVIQSLRESAAKLELAESAVKAMRDSEALKESECLTYQKNVADLKKQIATRAKLKETVKTKRDKILAYKLISGIDWIYSTKKISGIVKKEKPVAFKINPENLTQEQITETLWDLVLKE